MTDNNEMKNEVTYDEKTRKFIEELMAKDEEEKAKAELEQKRNATYEALKKDAGYPILKEGGIDEMIAGNRAILDTQAALQTAIQNATLKVQMKKLQETQKPAEKVETPVTNPLNPTATPSSDENKELSSKDFFDKMANGTATLKDLENTKHLDPFYRYQVKRVLEKGIAKNSQTLAEGRGVLGSDE